MLKIDTLLDIILPLEYCMAILSVHLFYDIDIMTKVTCVERYKIAVFLG